MTIDRPQDFQIPALRRLWQTAFGDTDEFLDGFFATGFAPERCRILLEGDALVAALYWFDCHWQDKKIAYLYAIATDPACQGKGFCRRLVTNTHAHLQDLGYSGALLVPGNKPLFSLYEKLGYSPCCSVETKTILAGPAAVPLQKVCANTYASAQMDYAPQNLVFHTQKALAFASTFNGFFEGNGFVFCGTVDKDTLFFQSFWGDPAALPGIVTALGAKTGVVRLPGKTPYGMYHSLVHDSLLPAVFDIPLN